MKRRILKKKIRRAERLIAEEIFNLFKGFEDEKQNEFDSNLLEILFSYLLSLRLNLSDWNTKERWIDGLINGKMIIKLPDTILLNSEMVWGLSADVGGNQWKEPFETVVQIAKNGKKLNFYIIKFGNDAPIEKKEVKLGLYSGISIVEIFNKNWKHIKNYETEKVVFEKYSREYSFIFSFIRNN